MHTCVLFKDGRVQCLGNVNQVGYDTPDDNMVVGAKVNTSARFSSISAGVSDETCGIDRAEAELWCWGRFSRLPEREPSFGKKLKQVAVGGRICVLDESGDVRCAERERARNAEKANKEFEGAEQIGADGHTACALRRGEMWCWGSNQWGQTGRGELSPDYTTRVEPQPVKGLPAPVKRIAGVGLTTCAHLVDDSLWCWGNGSFGGLGDGRYKPWYGDWNVADMPHATLPQKVPLPGKVLHAPTGGACVLLEDHSVWCWGRASGGIFLRTPSVRLKTPDGVTWEFEPHPIRIAQAGTDNVKLWSSGAVSCALKSNGRFLCWGYNSIHNLRYMSKERWVPILEPTDFPLSCD
jgi:hypothetical protein